MAQALKPDFGFAERLKLALGEESENAFAARCPAISRPLLRKYLSGSEPGMSKVVAMAEALGVAVEWLATGRGMMRPGEPQQLTVPAAPASIDEELLDRIAAGIAEVYRDENARIFPLQLVQLAGRWYADLVAACPDPSERAGGLKAMLQQLRRELRSPHGSGVADSKRLA